MDGQPSRASNKSDLDKPVDDDEEEDIEENDKNRESESDVRLVTLNCFVLGDFIDYIPFFLPGNQRSRTGSSSSRTAE